MPRSFPGANEKKNDEQSIGIKMTGLHFCDICGRSEVLLQADRETPIKLQMDEDGLWVCDACRPNLVTAPTAQEDEADLDERIRALIGKSAGAICRTTNLPFVPPSQTIMEAASLIAYDEDRHMSAWSFVTQWLDGTTVWLSADKRASALVDLDGNVQIRGRG